MTAPPSSIHKKLIFVSAGCAVALLAVFIIGLVSMRQLGFEPPARPRSATPQQSSAAVDSLSRIDFTDWLGPGQAERTLRCAATDPSRRVQPVPPGDSLAQPFGFGDTFPPGSTRRGVWEQFGARVDLIPADGAVTPAESLPPGLELLAAVRVRVQHRDRVAACLLLTALVQKLDALESAPHLDLIITGVGTARDAVDMVTRDSVLQELTRLTPGRAAGLLRTLDDQHRRLRDLRATIDAAGTSPASTDSLARWAVDPELPLPVRDAFIQAIGYGWVLDPPEMTFSVNAVRQAAIDRLIQAGLPEPLERTAREARRVMQGNLAQRFQFAVLYRSLRELAP